MVLEDGEGSSPTGSGDSSSLTRNTEFLDWSLGGFFRVLPFSPPPAGNGPIPMLLQISELSTGGKRLRDAVECLRVFPTRRYHLDQNRTELNNS